MMVQFTSEKNVITARNLSENAVYLCTVYALNSVGNVSTDDALRICKLEKNVWGREQEREREREREREKDTIVMLRYSRMCSLYMKTFSLTCVYSQRQPFVSVPFEFPDKCDGCTVV